jgi:hypothetical protein
MEKVLIVKDNVNDNNITNSEEVCVYDFSCGCTLEGLKSQFFSLKNRSIRFKYVKLASTNGQHRCEEDKREEEALLARSIEMVRLLDTAKEIVKKLEFEFIHASQGDELVSLFCHIAAGEYPNLSVLSFKNFSFSSAVCAALIFLLTSDKTNIQQLTLRCGNIHLLDKHSNDCSENNERNNSIYFLLLKAIVGNLRLRKVFLDFHLASENVFKTLNKFKAVDIRNNINTLEILDTPAVSAVGMGWLRCFGHLQTLRLHRCRLNHTSLSDVSDRVGQFLPNLTVLSLVQNGFKPVKDGIGAAKRAITPYNFLRYALQMRTVVEFAMSFNPKNTGTLLLNKIVKALEANPLFHLNGRSCSYYKRVLCDRQDKITCMKAFPDKKKVASKIVQKKAIK